MIPLTRRGFFYSVLFILPKDLLCLHSKTFIQPPNTSYSFVKYIQVRYRFLLCIVVFPAIH